MMTSRATWNIPKPRRCTLTTTRTHVRTCAHVCPHALAALVALIIPLRTHTPTHPHIHPPVKEEAASDGCVFSGWLSKKPKSQTKMLKRRWKARWFRLIETNEKVPCPTIYYYTDDKASGELGKKVR